jgi:hypothetical protein
MKKEKKLKRSVKKGGSCLAKSNKVTTNTQKKKKENAPQKRMGHAWLKVIKSPRIHKKEKNRSAKKGWVICLANHEIHTFGAALESPTVLSKANYDINPLYAAWVGLEGHRASQLCIFYRTTF